MPKLFRCVLALGLSAILASGASARETVIADHVLGPEGPLFVDGKLYYVAWNPGSLSVWDGRMSKVINDTRGCSHNGLALTRQHTLLLRLQRCAWRDCRTRSLRQGASPLAVRRSRRALRRGHQRRRRRGKWRRLCHRVRAVRANTDRDRWQGRLHAPRQQQLERSRQRHQLCQRRRRLRRPEDTLCRRDGQQCHHCFRNRCGRQAQPPLKFRAAGFACPEQGSTWWAGPDSLKVDSHGDLYVAQFYSGRILKISPQGKLLHSFDIAAGNGPTNVAFGPREKDLYVSVVKNADDLAGEAEGSIVRIPNVP